MQRREYNEQKELESLRRVFDTLDKDKNNKIDFKEVRPRASTASLSSAAARHSLPADGRESERAHPRSAQ